MAVKPQLWSLNGLAAELGINRPKLAKLLATLPPNHVEKSKGGTTERWLMAAVHQHLVDQATGTDSSKAKKRVDEDARLKAAQADLKELELAERTGQLVDINSVGVFFEVTIAAVRQRLLAIPRRLAPVLPSLKSPGQVEERIRKEVHGALTEMAGLDLEKLARTLAKDFGPTGDDEPEPPAKRKRGDK